MGCRHSSVDSSASSILLPQVRVPSTPTTLKSFTVKFVLYLSMHCEKNKINKKRLGFARIIINNQPVTKLNIFSPVALVSAYFCACSPIFRETCRLVPRQRRTAPTVWWCASPTRCRRTLAAWWTCKSSSFMSDKDLIEWVHNYIGEWSKRLPQRQLSSDQSWARTCKDYLA